MISDNPLPPPVPPGKPWKLPKIAILYTFFLPSEERLFMDGSLELATCKKNQIHGVIKNFQGKTKE